MSIKPSLEQFRERAAEGNLVPVYQEILADMETPVSVFRKLESSEHAFLLESVENGEQVGRYSFLGADPILVFRSSGDQQEIIQDETLPKVEPGATPIETLRKIIAPYKPVVDPDLPPFIGGAVGYMSYDMVRYFEEIPDENPDVLGLPDCLFLLADTLVAFDHVKHRMILIANAHINGDADAAYAEAVGKIQALRKRLAAPLKTMHTQEIAKPNLDGPLETTSNFTREEFEKAVVTAKEYIAAGDIFQVVLSQRFSTRITCDPFNVYRALRAVNPSPYMFYLKCGDVKLAGSSPEILVRCKNDAINLRPIAGTRPRGATPEEDDAYAVDLLSDEKEIAEHIMLVDLGRNDVGRVAKFGSVRVNEFKVIERYSHVMHIVSNVVGELDDTHDEMDVLGACFPAGTVSGAPKIRAMEIIDELENTRRGPYAGSVVYFGYDGAMDSCITIRTAVIKGDQVHVQAGAGIVADSVPANEFEETRSKARGLLRAIEWAENGLE